MSILLDAVTKSKHKHTEVADPALSPRQQYAQLHQQNAPYVKIGLFIIGLIIAVSLAWWLASSGNETQQVVEHQAHSSAPAEANKSSQPVSKVSNKANGVELAGVSALPIAQVYSAPKIEPYTSSQIHANEPVHLTSKQESKPSATVNEKTDKPSTSHSDEVHHQPIILGRQPTEDELAVIHAESKKNPSQELSAKALTEKQQQQLSLEALKRQLAAAASDVGLKTKEQQKQDELVKELDTELRKTEHQKSVRSSDKNDPMMQNLPKTKYQNVPTYGELPAGVQLQVPEFTISAHMYSTVPSQRRLSVNGRELKEGDKIKGKLKILEIRPRDVVLEIAGEKFKVPAI